MKTALVLCLVGHAANPGEPFSELRTGLDHLEFMVERREDLVEWAAHLDGLGIPHSGVKDLDYTANTISLKPAFFAEVNDGAVTLTFHFWSGSQLTYRLTKSGTSVIGSVG